MFFVFIVNSSPHVQLKLKKNFWRFLLHLFLPSLTVRAKKLGPVLKLVLCISVLPVLLISWPVVGILGSIVGGAAYGFLSPILATFKAVGEGRTDQLYHCFSVRL